MTTPPSLDAVEALAEALDRQIWGQGASIEANRREDARAILAALPDGWALTRTLNGIEAILGPEQPSVVSPSEPPAHSWECPLGCDGGTYHVEPISEPQTVAEAEHGLLYPAGSEVEHVLLNWVNRTLTKEGALQIRDVVAEARVTSEARIRSLEDALRVDAEIGCQCSFCADRRHEALKDSQPHAHDASPESE